MNEKPLSPSQQLQLERVEKLKMQNAVLAGTLIPVQEVITRLRRIRASVVIDATTLGMNDSIVSPIDRFIADLKQKRDDAEG